MSQAKVDKYKEEKLNRKQVLEQEKKQKKIKKTIAICVAGVLAVWVAYSGVVTVQSMIPRYTVEVDYTALEDYLSTLVVE